MRGGQPRAGEVVQRGERGAVGQARGGAHHRRLPARAPVRHVQHAARGPAELRGHRLEIGLRDLHGEPSTTSRHSVRYHSAPLPGPVAGPTGPDGQLHDVGHLARHHVPQPGAGLRLHLGRIRQPGLLGGERRHLAGERLLPLGDGGQLLALGHVVAQRDGHRERERAHDDREDRGAPGGGQAEQPRRRRDHTARPAPGELRVPPPRRGGARRPSSLRLGHGYRPVPKIRTRRPEKGDSPSWMWRLAISWG